MPRFALSSRPVQRTTLFALAACWLGQALAAPEAATSQPTFERRDATTAAAPQPPAARSGTRVSAAAPAHRPSVDAQARQDRCRDIVLRASLQSLSADDASYLRGHCS